MYASFDLLNSPLLIFLLTRASACLVVFVTLIKFNPENNLLYVAPNSLSFSNSFLFFASILNTLVVNCLSSTIVCPVLSLVVLVLVSVATIFGLYGTIILLLIKLVNSSASSLFSANLTINLSETICLTAFFFISCVTSVLLSAANSSARLLTIEFKSERLSIFNPCCTKNCCCLPGFNIAPTIPF